MDPLVQELNDKLVKVFNHMLRFEEQSLAQSPFNDLSVKEMHVIEAIGLSRQASMSQVAKQLGITLGTLTVAIQTLEKKAYVRKVRSQEDKRITYLILSPKGRLLYKSHAHFHQSLVDQAIKDMAPDQIAALSLGLDNLKVWMEDLEQNNK